MTAADIPTQKTEVLTINDYEEKSTEPVVPHERQIVDAVIGIWKQDPSTESLGVGKLHAIVKNEYPNWSVSEKRIKTLLKKFGLLTNSASQEQFTYANEIKSIYTPDIVLPPKVHIVLTSKRGKGLYAKSKISKGETIFEENQLFNVPPLSKMKLIKHGKACTYCGKLLEQNSAHAGISVLKGLDCNICSELWCSQSCKKADELHGVLNHNVFNPNARGSSNKKKPIDANAFLDLQEYAEKEQWNALYAIAIIYASIISDKSGVKGKQFNAMARVSQATRYKAINSSAGSFDNFSGGALFVEEQQEALWKEGYSKFTKVFPVAAAAGEISYEEFMFMMGTYNINNLDSCVYLTQSHLNHNCDPNTSVETSISKRVDGLKVIAVRDIRAGEELTTTYVNPAHTVQQRQRELRVNWGFICACQKCKDDLQTQQRRKSSSAGLKDKAGIRDMLNSAKEEVGDGIDLEIPTDYNGERRKSVRFDEKVIAVSK